MLCCFRRSIFSIFRRTKNGAAEPDNNAFINFFGGNTMKRFLVLTVVFAAMFLMISCGGSSSDDGVTRDGDKICSEFYADGECNGHNVKACNEDDKTWYEVEGTGKKFYCAKQGECVEAAQALTTYCLFGGDDTDSGDSGSEGGDTDPDNGDSDSEGEEANPFECDMPGDYKCMNGDSYVCQLLPTGDMTWGFNEECADGCDNETGACNAILRDCNESHHELCTDEETGLMWSKKSGEKPWTEANQYCEDLEELGFDDWRLPTIDELRTLILECEGTVTGGACPISEEAGILSDESWNDDCYCEESHMGNYTKFGTEDWYDYLWSSSSVSGTDGYWALDTSEANIAAHNPEDSMTGARCVRLAE